MVAFSDEFWNNAIETETYMPSIFLSMVAVWLTLKWDERKNEPRSVLYLFLAAYLIGLGNGIHLSVLLIAPTVFIMVLSSRPDWFSNVKLWFTLIILGVVGAFIKFTPGTRWSICLSRCSRSPRRWPFIFS